jgi:hypothetical protein
MIIRIYESGKLDLETIGDLLYNADNQTNFRPDTKWIHTSSYGAEKITAKKERIFLQFFIRWIGRESVIMWLTSNQVLFEVISYKLLKEEQDAINDNFHDEPLTPPNQLN